MYLRIYMTASCSEVLGPYKRFVIWVQGCNKRCNGCISKDSWDLGGGELISVDELSEKIIGQPAIEGITISGGEPFLQQEELCMLIKKIQERRDIGVIIYTGLNYHEIQGTELANLADLIIDGEYIEKQNDNKSLRGSSNQNIICVTERYKDLISEYYGIQGRKIELIFSDGVSRMIGIPPKAFMKMIGDMA